MIVQYYQYYLPYCTTLLLPYDTHLYCNLWLLCYLYIPEKCVGTVELWSTIRDKIGIEMQKELSSSQMQWFLLFFFCAANPPHLRHVTKGRAPTPTRRRPVRYGGVLQDSKKPRTAQPAGSSVQSSPVVATARSAASDPSRSLASTQAPERNHAPVQKYHKYGDDDEIMVWQELLCGARTDQKSAYALPANLKSRSVQGFSLPSDNMEVGFELSQLLRLNGGALCVAIFRHIVAIGWFRKFWFIGMLGGLFC